MQRETHPLLSVKDSAKSTPYPENLFAHSLSSTSHPWEVIQSSNVRGNYESQRNLQEETTLRGYLITHKRALTLGSLEAQLAARTPLFRQASRAASLKIGRDDPLHLGWEPSPFRTDEPCVFRLINLPWATAEGVVSLATLVDCLRHASHRRVTVSIDRTAELWSDCLGLTQLVSDSWNESIGGVKPIRGCWVLPLFRTELTSERICSEISGLLTDHTATLFRELKRTTSRDVLDSVGLFLREATFNVFQHAYDSDSRGLFGSITVTPVPSEEDLAGLPYTTKEELKWFKTWAGHGLMLEAAIADCGVGIPLTLWRDYADNHPSHVRDFKHALTLGPTLAAAARAELHGRVVLWAFDHRSTRKSPADFPDRLAALTWRGLHRAMNSVARMAGCVILRSGQARIGHAFHADGTGQITLPGVQKWEFPGTAFVVRIPLGVRERRTFPVHQPPPPRLELTFDAIVRASRVSHDLLPPIGRAAPMVAVCHSFRGVNQDDIGWLLDRITSLPPHLLQVHFCLRFTSDNILSQLHAYSQDAWDLPRLVVFWAHDHMPQWKFVGIAPEPARALIRDLEAHGIAKIGEDPVVKGVARRLANSYAPHLSIEDGTIRISPFRFDVTGVDVSMVLQEAFDEWCSESPRTWIFEEVGTAIRLRSGRLVKRYACVFEMLRANEFLTQVLGWRLATILGSVEAGVRPVIMADSDAANFIARSLLLEQKEHYDIALPDSQTIEQARPTVAFVDAIHRGDILRSLLARSPHVQRAISCLDLRPPSVASIAADKSVSLTCLLHFPFDAGEISEADSRGMRILELDRVTQVPGPSADTNLYQLGTNQERLTFLYSHPQLFKYGIQQSGGRTHVVTLSTTALVKSYSPRLLRWILELVHQACSSETISAFDSIVIFVRTDANLQDLLLDLGQALARDLASRVFGVRIPTAPAGEREVFGRAVPELLRNIVDVSGSNLGFAFSTPRRYVAVFLDDACVTGRGLLNFLVRVARAGAEQTPAAAIVIPLVSRFSPGEEFFYSDAIREIQSSCGSAAHVPLFFKPLFRLQVRSFDSVESSPAGRLLSALNRSMPLLDARLDGYLNMIAASLELSGPLRRAGTSTEVCSCPFYSGPVAPPHEVSTGIIWIRHLIALQEQNVAVSSELLVRLREACEAGDYGLLTVLAVEPTLLETPPLRRECRKDVIELAVSALRARVAPSVISNALCVLAMCSAALLDNIPEVLAVIGNDTALLDQFITFLWYCVPRARWPIIRDAVRQRGLPAATQELLIKYLGAFDEIATADPVTSDEGARQILTEALEETIYHGDAYMACQRLNAWVLSPDEAERAAAESLDIQRLVREAVEATRRVVLPATTALAFWARTHGQHGRAESELQRAWARATYTLNDLAAHADGLAPGPIGRVGAEEIAKLWTDVRRWTQFAGPHSYLARDIALQDADQGVFERWMPEFFSLPWEVAAQASTALGSAISISSAGDPAVVVVPIPCSEMRRIFNLLFIDMKRHGTGTGDTMVFRRTDSEAGFVALIQNERRKDDAKGSGMSQRTVARLAKRYGVDVTFPSKHDESPYVVQLLFTNVLVLLKD